MNLGDLGNFHKPRGEAHPRDSIGNMPIYGDDRQIGAIEFIPVGERLDLRISVPGPKPGARGTIIGNL